MILRQWRLVQLVVSCLWLLDGRLLIQSVPLSTLSRPSNSSRVIMTFSANACPSALLPPSNRTTAPSIPTPTAQPPSRHPLNQHLRNILDHPWYPVRGRHWSLERTNLRPLLRRSIIRRFMDIQSLLISTYRSSRSYRSRSLLASLLLCIIRRSFPPIQST
jgi:hypothetical protein